MAESTVIKEFLVALGYKVDESAMKKFTHGVASATKSVVLLGTAIEASAIAVATGVARFASNLEQLYFAAQRTSSSADQLQAFGLAARNFGSSIEEAQGAVENLSAFFRENPGGNAVVEGWLARVGLSMKGSRSDTDRMAMIGKMFALERQQGQWYLAHQQASMLHIPDHLALAMTMPGFSAELEAQEKRRQGWQKVSEAAHRFMVQLENLKMQFYQMMLGFEGPAMAALQHLMTKFSSLMQHHGAQAIKDLTKAFDWLMAGLGRLLDWLDTHGDEIQKRIGGMFSDLEKSYKVVKPAFEWTYDQFVKLDKATDGWSTKLLVVLATLKAMGATGIVTGILSLGTGLAKAAGGLVAAGAAEGAGAWAVAGAAFGVAAWGAIGYGLGTLAYHLMPEDAQRWIGDKVGHTVDWWDAIIKAQRSQRNEMFAMDNYNALDPRTRAISDARFNPRIELHIEVSSSGEPKEVARHVASEAETAVRRAAADLIREFAAVVR